jgi:hypothetical protein
MEEANFMDSEQLFGMIFGSEKFDCPRPPGAVKRLSVP